MPLVERTRLQMVRRFLATEVAGGVVLLVAAVVALVWASSPWSEAYADLWHTNLTIGPVHEDLRHWVNDLLMAVFFFVVGLEIKREVVSGDLREPRRAALPALAAVGGMVVPAGLYLLVNAGAPGIDGWGIPMATDIAFALGVLALLGKRVPASLKLFLLALAIVDDLGAIAVIALAYSDDISGSWLALAVGALLAVWLLWRSGVRSLPVHLVLGILTWWFVFESGVHATVAGVALALLVPVDVGDDVEHRLHPLSGFVIVPIFALANAGVELDPGALDAPGASEVALGVVLGLVVGKTLGITLFAWLAVRLGLAHKPHGASWGQVVGVAAVAGIGFTVSLFVAGLAFDTVELEDAAKLGILAASLLAGVLGWLLIRFSAPGRSGRRTPTAQPGPTA